MKKLKGMIIILAGLALIAAAVSIAGYNMHEDSRAGKASAGFVEQLESIIESKDKPEYNKEEDPPSERVIPDYILNPDMEMPEEEVDGYRFVAVLKIPALELDLPVISHWDEEKLKVAPCRYSGSAYKDDLVIAAHNYGAHFGSLSDLSIGDEVALFDFDGNAFYYKVVEVIILQPTAIEEMIESGWDLSLFTCTVGGQARVTVRCERINK